MKSSAFVGVALTLLMFLLVLTATVIFIFQGRQTLLTRNADLQSELQTTQANLGNSEGTRVAIDADLAVAESNAVLLEGQLVDSQQEVDGLNSQLSETAASLAELEQARLEALSRPPQVALVAPLTDSILVAGTPIKIIVVASDATNIVDVTLTIDEQIIGNYVITDLSQVVVTESWTPVQGGNVLLGIEVSNGRTSTVITETLSINVPISQSSTIAVDPNNGLRSEIEANVNELRGLSPRYPVLTTILSQNELQARINNIRSGNELSGTVAWLRSFDFASTDAEATELVQSTHAPMNSYYDAETGEMLAAGDIAALSSAEQLAYVHQYMRLLQDQTYDWGGLRTGLDQDAQLALDTFAVGEANLVQSLYLQAGYFSDDELEVVFEGLAELESTSFFGAESRFKNEFGLAFVQNLYADGGFAHIAATWEAAPQSTEQFLYPAAMEVEPQRVILPDLTAVLPNWTLLDENSFGAFRLQTYLAQQLNAEQVQTAVSGWGGDRYAIYERESDGALLMVLWLTWDSLEDSVEFAALYPNYPTRLFTTSGEIQPDGSECWQGDDLICLYQLEDKTFIVRAPDVELVTAVASILNPE